ncbi:TIM-barrel domain-containing protein [Acrocarpospora sp. B8E8]|uniref:glycoside hydrolase family 31 protein n=1 Tax=Acrocarpospora sp. B8E8 TaxID=3153572 RepID=UPI00325E6743
MIRHRPMGSGHPYAETEDQRVPARPLDGESVELRVRAAANVDAVVCEWVADGTPIELPMEKASAAAEGTSAGDGGHLASAQAKATRAAAAGSWSVRSPVLRAGSRYAYRFRAATADGASRTSRWFVVTAASWRESGGNLEGADRVVPGSVRWLHDGDGLLRVRFDITINPDEHVVGFGERFDAVDQRGRTLDAVVFEQYKNQGTLGRTYLPMPFLFVIGPNGSHGWHVQTSARVWFDVGASEPGLLRVEAETSGDLTLRSYEGSPTEILAQFVKDVGAPEELPSWVFRLWASANEWNTQARVLTEMNQHRDLDIPVGALVIEAWSDESTFTAFRGAQYAPTEHPHTWSDYSFAPNSPWPDPKAMIDELHARDIKVVLWQIPLQKMRPHPTGQAAIDARQLVEKGYGVREADGRPYRNRGWWFPLALMPDLSSQEIRDWWTAKRRYLVAELDIDGFKTDGGEHAWGHDLRYADGRRGSDGNNLVPVHYARAFGDLLRSCGKPPVTFSRSGFTGSQAHGAFWAGDEASTWTAFRSSITAGITASACGIVYWGWDIAGFSGPIPDGELYLRAAGTSCFMPIMQYHSEFNHHRQPKGDRTPWNIAERTGDPRVIPVFRTFAHLRERLVQYLTEQARAAVHGGAPLMRGLFFDHPTDPEIWRFPLQYQLGDALLVIPVTEPGVDQVTGYLPAGAWVDVWTGTEHQGAREVTLPAPIEHPPVLCRAERWTDLAAIFSDAP